MEPPSYTQSGLSTSAGRAGFITTIVLLIVLTAGLVLRVWVQTRKRRRVQAHDYLYFAGYVFAVGYSTNFLYGIYPGGFGMHLQDFMRLYPERTVPLLKVITASTFLWAMATTLVKLCLLGLFHEIFTTPIVRYLIWAIAALSAILGLSGILLGVLICQPFAYNWDKTITSGHCGDSYKMQLATCTINMVIELMIVLLPAPILWRLQMPFKSKVILNGIFSLGLCVCATNLTRILIIYNQDQADFTYSLALIGVLCSLEVNIAMICASTPTLASLVVRNKCRSGHGDSFGGSSRVMNSFARRRMMKQPKDDKKARPSESTLISITAGDDGLLLSRQDIREGSSIGTTSGSTMVGEDV
ncbi:hypothetical protein BJY01DRAFT_246448 [Aspergillus pseudoustus]|uniref:Rhodopsin domain-containing protein n=1 Tax=Aspergillus pseudoustus TaxID=1810923 RepID=A0ABR4K807_9EURO